jgi:Tfp pilus assembly protein PilP
MEAPANEPLPVVPADAPPPIPPSLSAKPAAEPDPEPTTPEEAAALELKNKTVSELTNWHDGVMQNYAFNTGLMNDPFMPIESVARPPETNLASQQDEERRRRLPLLQRLALNQFTLSAIVVSANPDATSALLDGGGRSFIVHRGTLIGPNGGYVKEITPSRVIVVEPQVNYRGETQMAETVFRMNVLEDDSLEEFKLEHGLDG